MTNFDETVNDYYQALGDLEIGYKQKVFHKNQEHKKRKGTKVRKDKGKVKVYILSAEKVKIR